MRALTIQPNNQIQFVDKEKPSVGKGQVLVKLKAAALNHRDQFIREGKYPGIKPGVTIGSDGCGTVEEIGEEVEKSWLGKEVIMNPNINWGEDIRVQGSEYSILGLPVDGTFAEYVLVEADRLAPKPEHLSIEEAASLPLAGMTAFRALFHHGKLSETDTVLISGVGGGVAQFAMQFAIHAGAKVYVTSSKTEKIEKAISSGALGGFDYKDSNWSKEAKKEAGGFDLVIDSAGGDQINTLIKLMKPAGKIVFYGATNGMPSNLDVFRMFWNQITLQGSTMANDDEFQSMVQYVGQRNIKPIVHSVTPFEKAVEAFDAMRDGAQMGKLVLSFA